jgi:hypothetical protein
MTLKNKTKKYLLNQYKGKKILTILNIKGDLEQVLNIFKVSLGKLIDTNIDNISIILFEDKSALVFLDFGCDGYRSGNWNLLSIE